MFVFAALLATSLLAREEGRIRPTASVSGVVSSVNGNVVTILNGALAIDTTGAVFQGRNGTSSIADVRPGSRIVAVITNADAAPGTALKASTVTVLDQPDGTLTGPVQAVDLAGSTFTVTGTRVHVTPETKIQGAARGAGGQTLADIKVGDVIAAEVRVSGSGVTATQVFVVPPIPSTLMIGTVKSITPTLWIVTARDGKDVTVTVSPQTRIEGGPKVGDTVHVVGSLDAAGNIAAIAIVTVRAIAPSPPPVAPARFEGIVHAISNQEWKVGTTRVQVGRETRILGSPVVGDTVRVTGLRLPDDIVKALLIEKR